MTPGKTNIVRCPHCAALAGAWTVASSDMAGAQLWTDGFLQAPLSPPERRVARCEQCEGFYWVADAEVVGELDPFAATLPAAREGVPDAWLEAPAIMQLDAEQYLSALPIARGEEEELYLRRQVWWRANDGSRVDPPAERSLEDWETENLNRLQELFRGQDLVGRIAGAEIARELGCFDDAESQLPTSPSGDYEKWASRVRELAHQQVRAVAVVDPPSDGANEATGSGGGLWAAFRRRFL